MPAKASGEDPYDERDLRDQLDEPEEEHQDPSDESLIAAVRAGETEAAAELFRRHRPAAVRFASTISSAPLSEDVVAESFERVFAALYQGRGPDDFRPYLFTTIRRVAVDMHRKHQREVAAGGIAEISGDAPPRSLITDDATGATLDAELVRQAFLSLPERWRLVLWYTAVESRTLQETADLLEGNPNSVAVLSFRAREGLRSAYLAQHVGADQDGPHREVRDLLPRWVRGGLPPAKNRMVEEHLAGCASCAAVAAELSSINSNLGALLGPAALGPLLLGLGVTVPSLAAGIGVATRTALTWGRLALAAAAASTLVVGGVLLAHRDRPAPGPRSEVVAPSAVLSAPTLRPRPAPAPTPDPGPRRTSAPVLPSPSTAPPSVHPPVRPRPTPSPAPATATGAPRPGRVDVGLTSARADAIGSSTIEHVDVGVRGPASALQLVVELVDVTDYRVHDDKLYGSWVCTEGATESSTSSVRRLVCRLPGDARPREFAIDVRAGDGGARLRLTLRPVGATDPVLADNSATIVLPAP